MGKNQGVNYVNDVSVASIRMNGESYDLLRLRLGVYSRHDIMRLISLITLKMRFLIFRAYLGKTGPVQALSPLMNKL